MNGSWQGINYLPAFVAGLASFLSTGAVILIAANVALVIAFSIVSDIMSNYDFKHVKLTDYPKTVIFLFWSAFFGVFWVRGSGTALPAIIMAMFQHLIQGLGALAIALTGFFIMGWPKRSGVEPLSRLLKSKSWWPWPVILLAGAGLGAGWGPNPGPHLGAILIFIGIKADVLSGMMLLAVYSLGLAAPLVATGVAFENLFRFYWPNSVSDGLFRVVFGALITAFGIGIFFDLPGRLMAGNVW